MTNSKQKGKAGELALAKLLREYGFEARRGQQFKGTPDSPDVVGLPGHHIECKRVESLNINKAYEQAKRDAGMGQIPVVFHRKNRADWLVTVDAMQYLALLKLEAMVSSGEVPVYILQEDEEA